MKIIFVPRTRDEITRNPDSKIVPLDQLQAAWGSTYQLVTLDSVAKFNLAERDQLYIYGGHGETGKGTVFWGPETNTLSAEDAAQRTAERFPDDCTTQQPTAKLRRDDYKGVIIKIYSCHSGEGGFDSFASRFARAFKPSGCTYELTILGYRGAISPKPHPLTGGNVQNSNAIEFYRKYYDIPTDYTGPKSSVVAGEEHRWSKINKAMYQSRTSEAREKIATIKAVKGVVV